MQKSSNDDVLKSVRINSNGPGKSASNENMNGKSKMGDRSTMSQRTMRKKTAPSVPSGNQSIKIVKKQKQSAQSVQPGVAPPPLHQPNAKQQALKAKKMAREKMKEFDCVKSECFTWTVTKLLGSGGFGDVYKVHKVYNTDGDTKEYAMKTEMVEGDRRMLRLKIEVSVLKQCWEQKEPEVRKHFVEFIDRGVTDKFKFMVMGLVGPSLEDIRKSYLLKNYSKPTALNASIQTLRAVWNLHRVGWLHRDIKPANFAVGVQEREDTVYILDFGIAKTIFIPGTTNVKVPRCSVKFLGTVRFAARACHNGKEQGRKDDLETWLYMVFDLFDSDNGLPWKRAADRNDVINCKEKFFRHDFTKCYKLVPNQFKKIVDYINRLNYGDEPDYKYIENIMINTGEENNIKYTKKLDWIGKLNKKDFEDQKLEKASETSSDNRQSGSEDDEAPEEDKKSTTAGTKGESSVKSTRSMRRKKVKKEEKSNDGENTRSKKVMRKRK